MCTSVSAMNSTLAIKTFAILYLTDRVRYEHFNYIYGDNIYQFRDRGQYSTHCTCLGEAG